MILTWGLCNQAGRVRDLIESRQGASVDIGLNGPRTATLNGSLEDPFVGKVIPGKGRMKVWASTDADTPPEILHNGLLLEPRLQGQRIELPSVDVSHRLQNASPGPFPVKGGLTDSLRGALWALGLGDRSDFMWYLIRKSDARARDLDGVPELGIIKGELAVTGVIGTERPADAQGTWDQLVKYSKRNRSPDFELEPLDRDDGVFARFNTYYPHQGRDLRDTVVLEYGHNLSELSWEPSGSSLCNRLVVVGLGRRGAQPVYVAECRASMRKYGVFQPPAVSGTDTRDPEVLQARAEEHVSRHAYMSNFVELTPSVEIGGTAVGYARDARGEYVALDGQDFAAPPRFGPGDDADYWIGDEITVRAKEQFAAHFDTLPAQESTDMWCRITDASIREVDEAGNAAVTLTCTPKRRHADVTGYESEIVVDPDTDFNPDTVDVTTV